MTWVKVQDSFVFNDRLAIAEINRVEFINFGGTAEDFVLLLEQDVDEDLIRRLLAQIYGNIDNWVLIRMQFEMSRMSYAILVSSPDFEQRVGYSEIKRVERQRVTGDEKATKQVLNVDPDVFESGSCDAKQFLDNPDFDVEEGESRYCQD